MFYNIEFGHIYSGESWGVCQNISLKIYEDLKKSLQNVSGVILIDDYHSYGLIPEIPSLENIQIYKESELLSIGNYLYNKIPKNYILIEKIKEKEVYYFKYKDLKIKLKSFDENTIYACPLLTAAWILFRIQEYPQHKLISILPKKYKKNEENAYKLIRYLMPELEINIEYFYY